MLSDDNDFEARYFVFKWGTCGKHWERPSQVGYMTTATGSKMDELDMELEFNIQCQSLTLNTEGSFRIRDWDMILLKTNADR